MDKMACRLFVVSLVLAACLASVTSSSESSSKCGYESCNKEKPGMINAHLVPHTHTDPGWLITADQYYYRFVQWVLYSLVPALDADPSRRFIYVEMSFFTRWWATDLGDEIRNKVRKFINEGRLEIILGGWVMNDEACTHYTAIINQNKRGFEFLMETFGECARPKIGWQIDPFGHSREQASIFAQYGFDGFFFGRLDRQDKDERIRTHTMEMVWEASPDNLGPQNTLFTGVLPNMYLYPEHLRFDVSNIYLTDPDTFIHDDPRLYNYNVDKKVDIFIDTVKKYQSWYNTSHVFITMGSDYNYVDASLNFREMDKLIKYVNARQANGSNINALYSTPSCYLKALNEDKRTWTTKQDDFFPYAHRNHTYWTGFYTSRPSSKYFTRRANSYSQSLKKLAGISRMDDKRGGLTKIEALEESVSLSQHHDAITGTEKQVVAYDYAERISDALRNSKDAVQEAYGRLIPKDSASSNLPEQIVCEYSNVSVCTVTQQHTRFEVTIFNPQATPRSIAVRIPVEGRRYRVYTSDGKSQVPCDVVPVMPSVSGIRPHQMKPSKNELIFGGDGRSETTVPGLGFRTFFVHNTDIETPLRFQPEAHESASPLFIEGDFYRVNFDSKGKIVSIENKKDGAVASFTQNFYYYEAAVGNNTKPQWQASGAYIMRPKTNVPIHIATSKWMGIKKGQVVQEARQQFSDWITQVVRVYKHTAAIEFEWTVGPIPLSISSSKKIGKEVITRYNIAGWGNHGTFYTDSNGREILERKLNYRPTWKADIDEPVAGNYYPINSVIYTKSGDGKYAYGVLNDRSQGGTSLNDGDIEMNLHRRLLCDDWLGVDEALNEPGLDGKGLVARGTHHIVFGKMESIAKHYRTGAQDMFQQPLITFSHSGLIPSEYIQNYNTKFSGLKEGPKLPSQVNLLSFEKFRSGGPIKSPAGTIPYLVRFEHLFEVKEDSNMSKTVSFDIRDVFNGFEVESVAELTLGANVRVDDIKRLVWNTKKGQTPSELLKALQGNTVTLKPMQIATLQANFRQ